MSHFNFILKNIVQKMLSHCLTIIIRDFNVYFLTKTNQSSTLQAFMNKYNFKFTFIKSTTINDAQIVIYGQMHQYNNVTLEQHKHIE